MKRGIYIFSTVAICVLNQATFATPVAPKTPGVKKNTQAVVNHFNTQSTALVTPAQANSTDNMYSARSSSMSVPPRNASTTTSKSNTAKKAMPTQVSTNNYNKPIYTPGSGFHWRNFILHGFFSTGLGITSTNKDYVIPERGAYNHKARFAPATLIGLQLQAQLTSHMSVVAQFVADGDDTQDKTPYAISAEWAFLKYVFNPNIQVRAGRFRLPAFMYSDTLDVGYTYPFIDLPSEVYRVVPFDNINGVDAIFTKPIGTSFWTLKFQPFIGASTSRFDEPDFTRPPKSAGVPTLYTAKFRENDIYGFNASVSNQYVTLRGVYFHGQVTGTDLPPGYLPVQREAAYFYGFGGKVNYKHFLVNAELAHRHINGYLPDLTGWYAMLGYNYKKFTPYLNYGHLKTTDVSQRSTLVFTAPGVTFPGAYTLLNQDQQSYTAGLNYQINNHMIAKVAFSRVYPLKGTAGLFIGNPRKIVNVYRLGVDMIF